MKLMTCRMDLQFNVGRMPDIDTSTEFLQCQVQWLKLAGWKI
jgi:hypothetical protein